MYSVIVGILMTSMGRHYVRLHEKDRDAQKVWRDYFNHMKTSSKAELDQEEFLTQLTCLRLSESNKSEAQQFIVQWLSKLRQYEEMLPTASHFDGTLKKTLLQNALTPVKEFMDIKHTETLDLARGRDKLDFEAYVKSSFQRGCPDQ